MCLLNICQINIVALSFPFRLRARIKNYIRNGNVSDAQSPYTVFDLRLVHC